MAQSHIISFLALRRLLQNASSTGLVEREDPAGLNLQQHDETQTALATATRHAWLSLEVALAGTSIWEQIMDALPHSEGDIFRQQMDTLLDLFTLAGLETDNVDARRRCREELRSARRANLLAPVRLDDSTWANEVRLCNDAASRAEPHEAEWHALWQVAGDLQQAGYPHLAGLVGLRSLWGEPLCLGATYAFLWRTLRGTNPGSEKAKGGPDECWRCLEVIALLLEEREETLVALLDRAPEGDARNLTKSGGAEAIAKLRQLGLNRYLHGDYQQAAVHFTAALKLDPANAGLYAHRGDAYRLQCEYERAIADFHVALQLQPASPNFLVSRAMAYQLSGEYERAVADCNAALQLNPGTPLAYRTRAAAYAELDACEMALSDLTEAIAQAPEDDAAYYQRGIIHNEKREFELAIADFNRVLRLSPHHIMAYLQRGHAYLCRSDYAHAISDYGEVLLRHPNNVRALSSRGRAYQLQGSTERAISDFSEALQLEPNNAQAYCLRGMLHRSKNNLDQARADLEEAIRLDPDNAAAFYHRGKILLAQGQFREALADFNETLGLQPKLLAGHLSRAVVHDRLGEHNAALGASNQAIQLNPRSAVAYLVRGIVHAHTGDYASAIDDLSQAIVLDERLTLAYQERSLAYAFSGDYEQALVDCNHVIAAEPRNAAMHFNRSVVYHHKGEVQLALLDYTRALGIDSRSAMAGWNQGAAQTERNRITQRLADYIEGHRPAPQIELAPPTSDFVIVIQPANTAEPGVSAEPAVPVQEGAPADSAISETASHAVTTEESTLMVRPIDATPAEAKALVEAVPPTNRDRPRKPVRAHVKAASTAPAKQVKARPQASPPVKKKPESAAKPDLAEVVSNGNMDSTPSASSLSQEIDSAINDLLSDSPDANPPTQVAGGNGAVAERTRDRVITPLQEPVRCSNCYQTAIPIETLQGGRVRCRNCKSVFLPSANTLSAPAADSAPRPPARKPVKKYSDDDESSILGKWGKPVPMAVVSVAILFAIYLFIPMQLFGKSDRAVVYAAVGKVELEGAPLANAAIFLHPVAEKDPPVPHPRATAGDDGAFVLGTYGKNDGAPAGEYKVTVQCFQKLSMAEMESGRLPRNLLPARYAKAETTNLTVQIKEGDNQLPTIKLTN